MYGIQTIIICNDCNKHYSIRVPLGKIIKEKLKITCQEHKPIEKDISKALKKLEKALWN